MYVLHGCKAEEYILLYPVMERQCMPAIVVLYTTTLECSSRIWTLLIQHNVMHSKYMRVVEVEVIIKIVCCMIV